MKRLALTGLLPGKDYSVQVRSKTDAGTSVWSPSLDFTTIVDDVAPETPTGATWICVGTSFLATWSPINTTLEQNQDFNHYLVTVAHGVDRVYFTVGPSQEPRFDLTLEANRAAFGTPQSPLVFTVSSVDHTGNISDPTIGITATNPVPGNVTVTTDSSVDQIGLKWTAATDADLEGYNIYASQVNGFTPGPSNKVSFTKSLSFTHFTTSYSPWYFHVKAVDVFGQESTSTQVAATANAPAGADITPPSPPTSVATTVGFDNTRQQAYIDVTWTASVSPDVASYNIHYAAGSPSNWESLVVDAPGTSGRIYVRGGTSYYVAVNAKDFFGNVSTYANSSTYPISTPVDTTAPSQPSAPTAVGNTMQVQVTHANTKQAGGAIEADTAYYDVYASKTTGFTPSITNYIGKLIKSTVTSDTFPLPSTITGGVSDTWYIKVNAVDSTGNVSTTSPQATVVPGLIAAANIADATITSAKITSLVADKITAGAGIIAGLTIGNATTAGYISSYDYVAGTTGWKIGGTSGGVNILEINSGLVKARALELKNSFNLLPPILANFEARRSTYDTALLPSGVEIRLTADAVPNGGTQALTLDVKDVDWTIDIGNGPVVQVDSGSQYIFSFYAKAATACSINAGIVQQVVVPATTENPASTALALVTSQTFALTTSYARYSFVFTGPSTSAILPRFFNSTAAVGNAITFDALQVEEKVGALSTPSRWMPPSSTTIDGGQIRTGSLQSNDVSTGRPAWMIDVNGGAEFSSAKVLGALVVGTSASTDLSYIQSGNYDTATAGWRINSAGKAEFNNAVIRGEGILSSATVTADLEISGASSATPATISLTNGSIQTIYGTLTAPPPPAFTSYDNDYYTMSAQIASLANLANMDYCGPVYKGTETWFLVAEQSIDDLWIYMAKADAVGATPVSYKSVGYHTSITSIGANVKTVLSGLSYDGSIFYGAVYWPDAGGAGNDYAYIQFNNTTGAYTGPTALNIPNVDRDNGYKTNWQKVGASWYAAYCLNTDVEENRVLNPEFASSIANWATYNGSSTTVLSYDAANDWLVVKNWGSSTNNYSKGATPVLASPTAAIGDNIYVSSYIRASSLVTTVRIAIQWSDGTTSTSGAQDTPVSGRISFNAVAPVAGTYTVSVYFNVSPFTWAPNAIAGYIQNMQVSNNGKNLRKIPLGFRDGDTTGWVWDGTIYASRSHRTFLEGQLLVDKYNATTGALEQRNTGHQIYSDITGFVVGAGDYTYANVTNPNTYALTRRPDPTQLSNNFDLTFFAYVNPGSGIGTALVFREGAYTFKDGLAYNSSVGDYRCYDKASCRVEILPHIHGDGFGTMVGAVAYWHNNATSGGILRKTLPSGLATLANPLARKRVAITNLRVPSVPGTVASTDAPTGWYFYWGSQGTTNLTKLYGTSTFDFASWISGGYTRITFNDMRAVPRTTPTTLVPANNGASTDQPVAVNGFTGVTGFASAKIRSANDLFTVDGNGAGRVGGLTFSELGLQLTNTFGGTSGQVTSATGGFILNHNGTGIWPLQQVIHYARQKTGAQNLTTGSAGKITFEQLDQGGSGSATDWSSYFSYSAGDVTVAVDGYYDIEAYVGIAFNATGYRDLQITVGGTTIKQVTGGAPGTTRGYVGHIRTTAYLAAGSVVAVYANQNSGSTLAVLTTSNLTTLRITRLGAR